VIQVGDQIADRFDPYGKTAQPVGHPDVLALRRCHRSVRHRRGVIDQRFDASEALGEREQTQAREAAAYLGLRSQLERHDPPESAHLAPRKSVLRVRGESRIVHRDDGRMPLQPAGDLERVVLVPFHAQRKRLDATQDKVAVGR